jgi:hypothetical protein
MVSTNPNDKTAIRDLGVPSHTRSKQNIVQHVHVLHLTVPRTSTLDEIYGILRWYASGGPRTQFLDDLCCGCRLPISLQT